MQNSKVNIGFSRLRGIKVFVCASVIGLCALVVLIFPFINKHELTTNELWSRLAVRTPVKKPKQLTMLSRFLGQDLYGLKMSRYEHSIYRKALEKYQQMLENNYKDRLSSFSDDAVLSYLSTLSRPDFTGYFGLPEEYPNSLTVLQISWPEGAWIVLDSNKNIVPSAVLYYNQAYYLFYPQTSTEYFTCIVILPDQRFRVLMIRTPKDLMFCGKWRKGSDYMQFYMKSVSSAVSSRMETLSFNQLQSERKGENKVRTYKE